ncbi:MAG: YqgE/AlgH family protein [Bacteroidales bacterium]|nr:YqgE/AlgH family protein [Bacteroidales bacterium]
MKKIPNIFKIKNTLPPKAGRILISEPLLNDGIFSRSVVLITEHNSRGTVGYVLNKLSGFTLKDILPDFKNITLPIYVGGPVATNTIHFIYKWFEPLTNSIKVVNDIHWGGHLEDLKDMLYSGSLNASNIKIFVGYSGWDKGQLDREIKNGYWVVSEIDSYTDIFDEDNKLMWKRNVLRLDEKYHFWVNVPLNPFLN